MRSKPYIVFLHDNVRSIKIVKDIARYARDEN